MIELAVVLVIISILATAGSFGLREWATNQRGRAIVRELADLMQLARAEAIRSGTTHVVFFSQDSTGAALLADDGVTAVWASMIADENGDGLVDAGELRHYVATPPAGTAVVYGRTGGRPLVPRNVGAMMGDPFAGTPIENSPAELASPGNFRHPVNAAAVQSWVAFSPDGMPRSILPNPGGSTVGTIGSGDGAIYVTNGTRDYAVVMAPLGAIRSFQWNQDTGQWR